MARQEKNRDFCTLNIPFSEEKMDALAIYTREKGLDWEQAVQEFLEKLYERNVPAQVKGFLAAKKNLSKKPAAEGSDNSL